MKAIAVILTISCLVGCSDSKKTTITYTQATDTLFFDQSLPMGLFQYKQMNGCNLLFFWNEPVRELLVYDIDKKKSVGSLPVKDTSFENFDLGKLRSFYVHNFDSIFVQRMYSISILDSSGAVRFRKLINAPGQDDWPPIIRNNYGAVWPIYYDATHQEVFTRQYSGNQENWKTAFFSVKVEASLSLSDTAFKEVPVNYPDIYNKDFYAETDLAFREADDSFNVYTFMASPDIYTYNRYSKEVKKFTAKSALQSGDIAPLDLKYKGDMNRKVDHLVENPLYMKIMYDRYTGLYYRFLLNGKKLKNEDGTYNEFGDKDVIISIFDRQFRLVDEVNVGSNNLWYFSFITPKGLYILKETTTITSHQNIVDGQNFVFDVFTFHRNQ